MDRILSLFCWFCTVAGVATSHLERMVATVLDNPIHLRARTRHFGEYSLKVKVCATIFDDVESEK